LDGTSKVAATLVPVNSAAVSAASALRISVATAAGAAWAESSAGAENGWVRLELPGGDVSATLLVVDRDL